MIENDIKLLEHCVLDLQHRVQALEKKIKQTQRHIIMLEYKVNRETEPIIEVYNGNADKENWQCITIKPIENEPQMEYNEYRERIRPHDPHKDW